MPKQSKLRRTLGLFDAVSIGLGAIIGAGIFVALGISAGMAGPGLILSVVIAGIVASFTALSFAELGSAIPKEGGAYEYVFSVVSPSLGFLTGWMWIFGQIEEYLNNFYCFEAGLYRLLHRQNARAGNSCQLPNIPLPCVFPFRGRRG